MRKLFVVFVALVLVFSAIPVMAGLFTGNQNNNNNNNQNWNNNNNHNDNDNTNINVNVNKNKQKQSQDQKQKQQQGQVQGQGQTQDNTLVNSFVIEDTRQHVPITGPMAAPGMPSMDKYRGFHNIVWLGIKDISMKEAKKLEMDEGYLWGCKSTVKTIGKYKSTKSIKLLSKEGNGMLVGVVTVRGNYGTKGYEVEARALVLAMRMGGKLFQVRAAGFEIAQKTWSVGAGSAGQIGTLTGQEAQTTMGGSGGGGTAYGTAKVKARPYITITVLR